MKRIFLASILALVVASPVIAQSPQYNVTQYRGAFAFEKLTVSSVSKALTSTVFAPTANCGPTTTQCRADYALITVEGSSTNCLRYRPDGTAPDSSTGHKACDGAVIFINGYTNILNWHGIRTSSDVTIQVSYYRFTNNTP